jgi:hypothetical protein
MVARPYVSRAHLASLYSRCRARQRDRLVVIVAGIARVDAQIIIATQIDFIVRRLFRILIYFEFGQIIAQICVGLLRHKAWRRCRFFERQRLFGFKDWFGQPSVTALNTSAGAFFAQIVKAHCAFWACSFRAPFRLRHQPNCLSPKFDKNQRADR